MNLTSTSPEVLEFLANVQSLKNKYMDEKFPSLSKPVFRCVRGTKFLAIDERSGDGLSELNGSVFCFIAACDGETKGMGKYKKGDIFKPAGWKAPAKHARGNIYNEDKGMGKIGPYGPAYL